MHWRNSNFQIAYFLAGKCHTPDGAYQMLMGLKEEREMALASAELNGIAPLLAKVGNIKNVSDSTLRANFNALERNALACYYQAHREREFIDDLITRIQPLRKYAHLPDHEAFQACQMEEWKLELIRRAENFLASQGFIPADHLETMRLHPLWEREILPEVQRLTVLARDGSPWLSSPPQFLLELQPNVKEKIHAVV